MNYDPFNVDGKYGCGYAGYGYSCPYTNTQSIGLEDLYTPQHSETKKNSSVNKRVDDIGRSSLHSLKPVEWGKGEMKTITK
jgi:hypothetical protein